MDHPLILYFYSFRLFIGIRLRKVPTWKDVLRVTKIFRNIDSHDPAKYDYVFSRPAIMGYCVENSAKNRCYLCPISDICRSRQQLPETRGKHLSSKAERKILDEVLKILEKIPSALNIYQKIGLRRNIVFRLAIGRSLAEKEPVQQNPKVMAKVQ